MDACTPQKTSFAVLAAGTPVLSGSLQGQCKQLASTFSAESAAATLQELAPKAAAAVGAVLKLQGGAVLVTSGTCVPQPAAEGLAALLPSLQTPAATLEASAHGVQFWASALPGTGAAALLEQLGQGSATIVAEGTVSPVSRSVDITVRLGVAGTLDQLAQKVSDEATHDATRQDTTRGMLLLF